MFPKKIFKIYLAAFALLTLLTVLGIPIFSALAAPEESGGGSTTPSWQTELGKAHGTLPGGGEGKISTTIATVIQTALGFVGVIFLVLMIYAGFLWMTARGNEQKVEKSKNLIEAAVIGLVIVLAAYGISVFVVSKILGVSSVAGGCEEGQVRCLCTDPATGESENVCLPECESAGCTPS